ncbi:MAG: CBS domain-containing protein [Geminicoccaceae bacterium]
MKAADIMTRGVVTVEADTPLQEVARRLARSKVTAVPVVDQHRHVIGMVSEGDLLFAGVMVMDERASWWLEMMAEGEHLAPEYLSHVRSAGRKAADIMTKDVVSVGEDTSFDEIAKLLHDNRIKRVPVLRNGVLVGIVSRADLVRSLAHLDEHKGR